MSDPTAIDLEKSDPWTDPRIAHERGYTAHGNIPIDCPFITKIADNLWVGGVESGLILPEEIKFVLSLYKWESYSVPNDDVLYKKVEMYDSIDQSFEQVDALAAMVNMHRENTPVLVHCQAGLNRSALIVARAMFLNGEFETGDEIIRYLRAKRSPAVLCNPAFEAWVRNMGNEEE